MRLSSGSQLRFSAASGVSICFMAIAMVSVPGWQKTLGVTIILAEVRGPDDFDATFAALMNESANGPPCQYDLRHLPL